MTCAPRAVPCHPISCYSRSTCCWDAFSSSSVPGPRSRTPHSHQDPDRPVRSPLLQLRDASTVGTATFSTTYVGRMLAVAEALIVRSTWSRCGVIVTNLRPRVASGSGGPTPEPSSDGPSEPGRLSRRCAARRAPGRFRPPPAVCPVVHVGADLIGFRRDLGSGSTDHPADHVRRAVLPARGVPSSAQRRDRWGSFPPDAERRHAKRLATAAIGSRGGGPRRPAAEAGGGLQHKERR